jgi:CelD/BcsL family acetyltransferase involved in cellulose biosynthesis
MTDTHGAAITAYSHHSSRSIQIAPNTSIESRSLVWPGARIAIHSDLAGIEPTWRAFESDSVATLFQQFDYQSAWFRHVGSRAGVTPAVVVVRTEDAVLAILPFAIERGRFLRKLSWLGQDFCDYLCPLISGDFAEFDPRAMSTLWREIVELMQSHSRFRHDVVEFRRMPATVEGVGNPMLALSTTPHASAAYSTALSSDWDSFYRERRTGKARKQDRSKLSRLSELGDVSLVTPRQTADIEGMLAALFRQKSEALDSKGIADVFAKPGIREFFLDLATNPRTRHLVHVSALEVGPSLAAVNLGFEFRQCYSLYLVSYDQSFARLSPGVIHLNKLMQRAVERGMMVFDFLVGEQRLKLEWTDRSIELHDHISASTWRGYPAAFAANMGTRVKRFIKQTPAIWSAFRAARTRLGALRRRIGG